VSRAPNEGGTEKQAASPGLARAACSGPPQREPDAKNQNPSTGVYLLLKYAG
jgi:hypothetical protein